MKDFCMIRVNGLTFFFAILSGWKILQSDCYNYVNVPMTWHDASQACHR